MQNSLSQAPPSGAIKSKPIGSGRLLAVALLVCFGASAIGGLFTSTSVGSWYLEINRPTWNPPGWVFGPVWSALYAMMAFALWEVWRSENRTRAAFVAFGVQLSLNVLWSALFFGLQSPGWAFLEIIVLVASIAVNAVIFCRVRPRAGLLLIPYLLWTIFATVLNGTIWIIN